MVTNVVMSFPAVLSDRLILLSFLEKSQVAAVYLSQSHQDSPETGRRADKLSPSQIKVQSNLIRESAGALTLVCMEERKVWGGGASNWPVSHFYCRSVCWFSIISLC